MSVTSNFINILTRNLDKVLVMSIELSIVTDKNVYRSGNQITVLDETPQIKFGLSY